MSVWDWLFRRRKLEEELEEEVQAHLRMAAQEHVEQGESPEQARTSAVREFGNVLLVKEVTRDMWGFGWLETLLQDLRFAVRMLRKNPGFTAVVVITLALGIGATTAIFTVVNGVLLRPLPYPHPEELVYVQENFGASGGISDYVSNKEFVAWRNQSRTLSLIAAYKYSSLNLTGSGEPERITCALATSKLFSLLGVHAVLGRVFLPDEDRPGSPPVAILSDALWKRRFGGDPSVIGKGLTLDGETYKVVGVLPAKFIIPDQRTIEYALWVPLVESETGAGPFRTVRAIGRLKPGVSRAAARSELDTILQPMWRGSIKVSVVLPIWHDQIISGARFSLLLFLGAVGLLLLIACVNVANLLLSRSATRQRETAVRLALGAGRTRIVQQLITESTLLALLGGLLGLALAHWGKDLLVAFISPNLPALEPIGLDFRVLGFNLGLAVLTGFTFGLAPALQASSTRLNEALKEASRGASEVRSGAIFRNVLVISEAALVTVLLVGSSLLLRSFLRVRGIDMGFRSEHILSFAIDLTPSKYPTPRQQSRFFQQVIEGIKGLEGVQAVAGSAIPPLGNRIAVVTGLVVEGRLEKLPRASFTTISPDYFRTMGIPLIGGRNFTDADQEGSPSVAIVDESFGRRFLPGENCLGRRIKNWTRKNDWLTIVGVVGDVRNAAEREPTPEIYLPYLQAGKPFMTFLVHTAGNPMLWAAAVRSRIASVDRDQPAHDIMTLEELRAGSLQPRRVNMLLLGAFAVLGLILASVGIYGVVSYSVSHRTHEIGVRMALGARQGEILKLVIAQGLFLALVGTGIGLIASLASLRCCEPCYSESSPPTPPLSSL
jgi:putative ABC transport system permease protein